MLGKSQERRHFRKDLRKDLRKIFRNPLTLTQEIEINVRNNNERRILYVLCVVVIFDVI